jgi:CubicO group peptidase (beta-lactamase class C family)
MGFDPYRVPTPRETVEWILSQELQFPPDSTRVYSNVGYLILGLIVEQVSGTDLYSFWREYVLDESMWFPSSEFEPGRTFAAHQNPREPWYNSPLTVTNVFDPDGPDVRYPYGGWDHEARIGQGSLITNPVPLLNYLDTYYVNGDEIGMPLNGAVAKRQHGGRLRGTNSLARQRNDGVHYVIILNKRVPTDDFTNYVELIRDDLDALLDQGTLTWPTQSVDGVWVDFAYGNGGQGCYDDPFDSLGDLNQLLAHTKVRLKSRTTTWTGVITRSDILLSAPEGSAVISGQ